MGIDFVPIALRVALNLVEIIEDTHGRVFCLDNCTIGSIFIRHYHSYECRSSYHYLQCYDRWPSLANQMSRTSGSQVVVGRALAET